MTKLESKPPNTADPGNFFNEMSAHELERFLEFVSRFMAETQDALLLGMPAREVPIMVQLMRSHLRGRLETPSSLIDSSGLARGTAHRLIEEMVETGLIVKRPRTRSGKTFSLHPTRQLIDAWVNYLRRVKSLLGGAFGLSEDMDYFFGASYLATAAVAPLPVMSSKLNLPGGLRILLHADAGFMAMQKLKRQFEMHFGAEIEVRALSIDRLHQEIRNNAGRRQSRYDLVTCDVCWMEEMIQADAIRPVQMSEGGETRDLMDFHPEALSTVQRDEALYGIPVQTTPELFLYRTDIFEQHGLDPPQYLSEVLACARQLHGSARGLSGICWNGARGTPVGTSFMMLMADFGQPVLNLPRMGNGFRDQQLAADELIPMLDSNQALEAADFLVELLSWSPPNVLQMSWYERARCYADGQAAMGYCYTQILPMIENQPDSPGYGRTGYLPHPTAPGVPRSAPLGGWNICVPANLKPARIGDVTKAARTLTSAAATKLYIENGSLVSSRFSVCNDPVVAHGRPVIATVDQMARAGQLQTWARPAVPQLNTLVRILGEEIHTMLLRNKKPAAALRDAQARCERAMGL
ncbi:ABC transporter substrate-binding protein [Aestuariicoccus sp. MJ-SS9]|uniref:ABC transporter substrate-binding protein n=1 Tax=Aestuariicoccus sp. MJ-SS9 TaxID=3079855 RepID=UPI00290ED41D|nr:extracellular solute-binding protein [Aestuariicoccus sp. MJ-SS9]MDU8913946.1 extracellular solute-binding protein [Aestuariicoccus sp. MJ-SS9]